MSLAARQKRQPACTHKEHQILTYTDASAARVPGGGGGGPHKYTSK